MQERSTEHKEVKQTDTRCGMREREFRQCTIYLKHQNAVTTEKGKIKKEENPECKREADNLNCVGSKTGI